MVLGTRRVYKIVTGGVDRVCAVCVVCVVCCVCCVWTWTWTWMWKGKERWSASDKSLMVDRVSCMRVCILLPISNSPMGSKTIFLHFKDIKCSVCVKIASVSQYGGSNSTDE